MRTLLTRIDKLPLKKGAVEGNWDKWAECAGYSNRSTVVTGNISISYKIKKFDFLITSYLMFHADSDEFH